MKIAVLTRPGECFPNIISRGLSDSIRNSGHEAEVFDQAIPTLMRILPYAKSPRHWRNSLHYRTYNKLKYRKVDQSLLSTLRKFDLIILSECLPNAYWRNFLAIEELKEYTGKAVLSFTDAYYNNAPIHQNLWFEEVDYKATRFDCNLTISPVTELRSPAGDDWAAIGLNLRHAGLSPVEKDRFFVLLDFQQKGYEAYREQQIKVLQQTGIDYVELKGRYPIEEIRALYRQASMFFLSFPETFGLPIAECLSYGTAIVTPNTGWPMAWRLNQQPMPWGHGELPGCFVSYDNAEDLKNKLIAFKAAYDLKKTPFAINDLYLQHYPTFYDGNDDALQQVLSRFQ